MKAANRLRIGDITVERILETEAPFITPEDAFIEATPEAVDPFRDRLEPWALCPETGRMILAIQSYLVRTPRHTILIDTCIGCGKTNQGVPAWHRRSDRSWLDRLAAAGVRPEAVDFVLCTHLHSDHCGWNTQLVDGRWVPTFPNAEYVMARREVEPHRTQPSDAFNESVLPVIDAGQAVLVDMDHALADGVRLEPTPGHTPGHVAVRLASNGQEAVMCGDLIHSPLQCAVPHWRYAIDWDAAMANRTRRAFLERHCETGCTVLTAHFPSPSMGRIVGDGDAFDFRFVGT